MQLVIIVAIPAAKFLSANGLDTPNVRLCQDLSCRQDTNWIFTGDLTNGLGDVHGCTSQHIALSPLRFVEANDYSWRALEVDVTGDSMCLLDRGNERVDLVDGLASLHMFRRYWPPTS